MKFGPVSPAVRVESLDQEGRGVAHLDGKVIFIEGALTGETVEYVSFQRKPSYELAEAKRIIRASVSRVPPRCRYFGVCGGCSMQHLDPRAQVAAKQRVLEDNLARIGKVTPETLLSPIHGPTWQYRYRARFSARHVAKKGTLVGFRERRSSFVVDMQTCEVVPARISALLAPLRELIASLSIRERLPQIELAIGDAADVLVLRVLEPPDDSDLEKLRQFATRHRVQLLLQPKGPDSVYPLFAQEVTTLQYRIPDFDTPFLSARRILPRSITRSIGYWYGGPFRCSIRNRGSASPIFSAVWGISRWRLPGAARKCSVSKATRAWCSGRTGTPYSMGWETSAVSLTGICSRSRQKTGRNWRLSTGYSSIRREMARWSW